MQYDPKTHRRHSIRLKGFDYSRLGAYFVTVVSRGRESLFGEIVGGEMRLNQCGVIVREEWERTSVIRPDVELGAYVVMPNHLHGILVFRANVVYAVGATRRVATKTLQPGSLGAIMAQFKSIVTKRIHALCEISGAPIWQRNYYEHVIRNQHELENIWNYIESNPARWKNDDENRTLGH